MEQRIFEQFLKVRSVTTDTRKIEKNTIFFALKGDRFNGNSFALQALAEGASMAVVDEQLDAMDDRIVLVADVLATLQKVALLYRRTLKIPFLAITGSNGKTTTKELIRDVLSRKYRVSATIGNLNNHIGIPLTILAIPQDCEFAVIEMGANHQREISGYCMYTEPEFGLITNMGKAHLEGFGGEEGVVKGKKELYDYIQAHGGKLFVNVELEKLRKSAEGMDVITYGFETGNFSLKCVSESPTVEYAFESGKFNGTYKTQLAGAYNMFNIASAIAVGQYFGIKDEEIHDAIARYIPDNNRSQIKKTNNNTLILDAYNANPTSLEYALIGLSRQSETNRFFVIGDMLELGQAAAAEHLNILKTSKELGLKGILVGPIFRSVSEGFDFQTFADNVEARKYLESLKLRDHIILVKGSRGIKLEEVLPAL